MKFMTLAIVTCCALASPAFAQQTGLTQGQLDTADIEVPRLIEMLDLQPGMTIADVGAGFGAWTMRFARWVGTAGRVYTTDVGEAQLAALREMVARERLSNVTVIAGGSDTTNLPESCCDAILIRDAYHHLTRPAEMVRSLAAALKPGGRLVVVDFPPRANSEVPAGVPADRGGHGVPPDVVEREGGAVLTHLRTITDWSPESQPASLFLVLFEKPGR